MPTDRSSTSIANTRVHRPVGGGTVSEWSIWCERAQPFRTERRPYLDYEALAQFDGLCQRRITRVRHFNNKY